MGADSAFAREAEVERDEQPFDTLAVHSTGAALSDATAGPLRQTGLGDGEQLLLPGATVLADEPGDADHVAQAAPLPRPHRAAAPASQRLARVGEELFAWFKTLVSAAVYATLIVTFGFQVARVEGQSMAPTLEDQDRLIVNKIEYRFNGGPRVGDIVMLLYPDEPEKSFVKRVVAEPGDTIRSVSGRVYRNDVLLPDDFIPEEYRMANDTWGPEVIRKGYYFVMGDHRNNSSDSRSWGLVPKKYIIGRVQLRWWPINRARLFSDWPEPAEPAGDGTDLSQ
jgi:signal peptidase I